MQHTPSAAAGFEPRIEELTASPQLAPPHYPLFTSAANSSSSGIGSSGSGGVSSTVEELTKQVKIDWKIEGVLFKQEQNV